MRFFHTVLMAFGVTLSVTGGLTYQTGPDALDRISDWIPQATWLSAHPQLGFFAGLALVVTTVLSYPRHA